MPKLERAVMVLDRGKQPGYRMHSYRVSQELKAAKQLRIVPGPKPVNQNELPGDWISIQENLPLIMASQIGEFILPTTKKGENPFFKFTRHTDFHCRNRLLHQPPKRETDGKVHHHNCCKILRVMMASNKW